MSLLVPQSESAFRRFLASLGIGAASMDIQVGGMSHPRGSQIKGVVRVNGGQVTQHFGWLTVRVRAVTQGHVRQSKVLISECLQRNLTVKPRQELGFPFTFFLPDDARLTRLMRGGPTDGCILEASLGVRSVHRILNVTNAREIAAVLHALRNLGFGEKSWFHLTRPDENVEATAAFRAPENLQEQLETLSIFVRVSGQHVIGKAVLVLRPNSLRGHVRGLVGGNRVEHPFFIPRTELLATDGQPNPQGAIPYLKQLLSFSLALPDDPKSWMLRPSMSPPADPDTLLRPAMPTSTVSSDSLLRPTTPPETER
jgi:hypothetical protein